MNKLQIRIIGLIMMVLGALIELKFRTGIIFIPLFISGVIVIISTFMELKVKKDYHINMTKEPNTETVEFAMNKKTMVLLLLCFSLCCVSSFLLGVIAFSTFQFKVQALPAITQTTTVNVDSNDNEKININTAGIKALQQLSGIGESKAKKIVKNRPYKSIHDLLDKGIIGIETFNNIRDVITSGRID